MQDHGVLSPKGNLEIELKPVPLKICGLAPRRFTRITWGPIYAEIRGISAAIGKELFSGQADQGGANTFVRA